MTTVTKVSAKIEKWASLMGYDIQKIKTNMKESPITFGIEKLTAKEANDEGCDLNYPYRLYNPYNYDVAN